MGFGVQPAIIRILVYDFKSCSARCVRKKENVCLLFYDLSVGAEIWYVKENKINLILYW